MHTNASTDESDKDEKVLDSTTSAGSNASSFTFMTNEDTSEDVGIGSSDASPHLSLDLSSTVSNNELDETEDLEPWEGLTDV